MIRDDVFKVVKENYKAIILRVTSYGQSLIDSYIWFRGKAALPSGLTAKDFAFEALTRLLEHPESFDNERSGLTVDNIIIFLSKNVVRNLIRGLNKKSENHRTDDSHDENFETVLPFTEVLIDEKIDFETIKGFIQEALSEEEELAEIFTGIYEYDLTRAEICDQLNISAREYNNRMKRLGNRLNKAAKEFTKKT